MKRVKKVVFDLDGTLFDGGHRVAYIPEDKSRTENWKEFNDRCADDPVVPQMHSVFMALKEQLISGAAPFQDLVFITARTETCEEQTLDSLQKHGMDGFPLYMRGVDDHRTSAEVKSDILDQLESEGSEIYMAFDDDIEVVNMMRERGIYAIHVFEWWKFGVKVND